jgi:hypothetical protein
MPMAPYKRIDLGMRMEAIRDVGIALTQPTYNIPSQSASYDLANAAYWINKMRVSRSLGALPSLDHSGFVPALNVLVALVP